jgi:hypothetical protein
LFFVLGSDTSAALQPSNQRNNSFLAASIVAAGIQITVPNTQPLEPILFPKLRIYFADFPYLHCSID